MQQDLGLMRRDGFTEYTLNDEDFVTTAETRKGKDGQIIETGVTKRVFVFKKTNTEIANGEGTAVVLPDGKAATVREVRITERYLDSDAIAARNEADRVKNMVSNLRRYLGLSKSTKVVAESDKLTSQDVANWMNGDRQLFGKVFDTLPTATKDSVSKVYAESIKVAKPKRPTDAQWAEMFAMAAENGHKITDEQLADYAKYRAEKAAKLAKMKAGKATTEVALTEQSDI